MTLRLEHLPADVLELSELARAALSGRVPTQLVRFARRLEDIPACEDRLDPQARAELARVLEQQLSGLQPHVAVLDAARSLAQPGVCAVVTGQQPGFTASPLYSIYKALSAIRLARSLTQAWERPVVALFWNHADDHDVAEVHHTHVVNRNLDLQKISLPGLSSGRTPLSQLVLEDERSRLPVLRAVFEQLLRTEPELERAMAALFPRAGETLARAFTRAMTEVLGPLGLVVVEPDWIREPLSRALAGLLEHDPYAALAQGSERLAAAGYAPAIPPADAALLFHHERENGRVSRRALRSGGEGYQYDREDGSRTATELAAEIIDDPHAWSPGALLRPLVQDLCLPVAAYVGGFGELGYHAQLSVLRERAGAPSTAFVARLSATLVDPEARLALQILETDVASVLRARGVFESAEEPAEPEVAARLREVGERAAKELLALREALALLDPSLVVQLKRSAGEMEEAATALAEKARRVHGNRAGKGRRHERRVSNLLCPRGEPQERLLGPLPFVARFGTQWLEELAFEHDPFDPVHLVVHLGPDLPNAGGDA
ncbi:MAG: bacillithiol biosynthesis cysteine-adding enzyme BshC [Planctomycetes bacterium]|nr:bacillithiol biosynthesis cysteine-adding enzyme BshC [Planctomycetota bacterium]